ncbi:NAD(P)-binding Rossmann-fold superfamily protein isoform 2 [Hibiscus syriacus]|uniref:NAD(P)-binding Rossmann-fold superfamily protein isoform 2 n=1 Tax=Hibiscus syriacus TaxID=106335 RepID=A0A6A3AZ76_HIBSY|nr:NAD(P)-binding Rossmann-fold superfamily protein isoform 2 [Hibiscus syriacus]
MGTITCVSNFTNLPRKSISWSSSLSIFKNPIPIFRSFSFSSSVAAASLQVSASSSTGKAIVGENDLLIVGPGVLGRLVAEKWRETKTDQKFPYVIFCAPSKTPDYPGDIRLAALSWNGEGSFIFTSSSATDTPNVPVGRSPRTDNLLKAEKVVLDFDGCVVRDYRFRPDHILNLIHYEDAASLSVTILKKKLRGRIFFGCDNHPLSRQEVMDLVDKSGKFDKKFEGFTGTIDPLGKKLNNSKTHKDLGWEPKYPSFAHFLGVSE